MLAVLNLKMLHDRYPSPMGNPHNDELKIGNLVMIKNQTIQSPFDARYKPSYGIIKKIGDKSFNIQDPTGKVKEVSARHLQFMYPAEYYVKALAQIEIYGRTAKFIKHPGLMPDPYKDWMMTGMLLWINKQCQQRQVGMLPWVIHNQHLSVTTCGPAIEMLYMY